MRKIIPNEAAMADFAAEIAPILQKGDVVTLMGDLGAGKTAFCRALVNALSPEPVDVPSPTFTLVQVYDLPGLSLWHFDLYRLEEKEGDILELGWDDARRFGAALVEWPDRLGSLLPKDRLEINIAFEDDSENVRIVELAPKGRMAERVKEVIA
ncbi:MAG: tRNA (adenosine(37)-N6)-threonylcarbamoyltransferase complex ATPase subunit type 1 TsaE [Alphaproteobacteria bacterium]|nr:tRNA (adenosine(37)-N6)-threonylcarbamoyltransferase complex ATPase subunit type 1 TsaE [Alphaproteobacteria bacterium]